MVLKISWINGFASNNMRELYDYIEFLYHNPDEAVRIGQAARKTAQEVFHIDKFVVQWNEVLEQITYESDGSGSC